MIIQRIFIIGLILLCTLSTYAQAPRLTVEGDVKIEGDRLEFTKGSMFIGHNVATNAEASFDVNLAIGYEALRDHIAGSQNIAIGQLALGNDTTGQANVAIGHSALRYNLSGYSNTAVGNSALANNKIGIGNVAIGLSAIGDGESGNHNTATGISALEKNTGNENVAMGYNTMNDNTQGNNNVAVGTQALYSNFTANGNVALGHSALYENYTGINNTAVGYQAYDTGEFFSNSTAIGYNSHITGSNQIRFGNTSVSSIGGYEPWSILSDKRVKKNVKKDIPGIAFITQLRPVSYQLDMESIADWHETPDSLRDFKAEAVKGKIRYSGFLAQEVANAAREIGYEFSGVDTPQNEGDRYALRYSQFVVPLVKAVQELEEERQESVTRIEKLEQELAELKALLIEDQQSIELRSNNATAKLTQNNPNPFEGSTTIRYFIPDDFQQAIIRITNNNGKLIKDVEIYKGGVGQITVDATLLTASNYFYSLIVDGRLVESKQMILSK